MIVLAEFDGCQLGEAAKLESLTRENVSSSVLEDCIIASQPCTSRSDWSVDSAGQDEVQQQTSKNRLTAPPPVAAPPAILSSRDRSIADYS